MDEALTPSSWQDYIVVDPTVLAGKPVIRGTRISVERVLEMMAGGAGVADMLDAYPHLRDAHIRAALSYAASHLARNAFLPIDRHEYSRR